MGFDGFFLSAEFIRRWEGEPPSEPNLSARCEVQFLRAQKIFFFGSAGALPSRKFAVSPFASRYSQIAAVSARQEPRPPIFAFVPRPASHDPFRSCPVSLVPCPV
jgi:hypothetical protein